MYQTTWDTPKSPFHVGPRGGGFYRSSIHEEALARLEYLVSNYYRLGMLVGPSGTGKTALTGVFAHEARSRGCEVANFSVLGMDRDEFVWRLATELGEMPTLRDSLGSLWQRIQDRLAVNHYQQLPTIVVLDDVHDAEQDVLQAITRLVQWQPNQPVSLTILVIATEDKTDLLGPRLLDLCELRVELHAWLETETYEFIQAAVSRSGHNNNIFSPEAITRIQELSAGIPRRVRQIAELSLVAGNQESSSANTIQAAIVDLVQAELRGGTTNSGF